MFIQQLEKKIQAHNQGWDRIEQKLEQDEIGKEDIETDLLHMEPDGTFTIEGVSGYELAEGSHRQVFSQFVPCGANYLKKCPPDLLAQNINHWIYRKLGKSYLVRTRTNGDKKVLRAVLSERYAKLDNLPIFEDVYHAFHDDYLPVSFDLNDTHFHLRLAHREAKDVCQMKRGDIVHTGIHISNSETGLGSVRLISLIYRLACSNGLISPHELASSVKAHMGRQFDLDCFFRHAIDDVHKYGLQLVESLKHAHEDRFEPLKAQALVEYIGKRYNWNKPFVEGVREHLLLQEQSKFGVIQAITHQAKQARQQERLIFERQAGELLARSIQKMANHAFKDVSLN